MQQREKKKLRQVNIAVLGARGHGKTSIVQWLTGKLQILTQSQDAEPEAIQDDGARQEEADKAAQARYFTTLKRQHHYLYHKKQHINIFDLPADNDQSLISNIAGIPNILFVVSGRGYDVNEINHLLRICELLNVKRIQFAINFMDYWPNCYWKRDLYLKIVEELTEIVEKIFVNKPEPVQTAFVPTAGFEGENILKNSKISIPIKHGIAKWIADDNIPSLLESMEKLIITSGKTRAQRKLKYEMKKKPLRLSVLGTVPRDPKPKASVGDDQAATFGFEELEDFQEDEENVKGVFAFVHSGKVKKNTKLLFYPRKCFAVVSKVEFFTDFQICQHNKVKQLFEDQSEQEQLDVPTHASAGAFCFIYFHNKERVKIPIGSIGGIPTVKKIPIEAESFVAKLRVVHPTWDMYTGQKYEGICGFQQMSLSINEVQAIFNKKYGKLNLGQHNEFTKKDKIQKNQIYQVRIVVNSDVCLEKFQFMPSCGQGFIFFNSRLLAIARIEEIAPKFCSMDHLPRVFAVPTDQLYDVHTKELREDWNLCQIDLNTTISALLLPCGHLKMCEPCGKKLNRCPFCKLQITEIRKMQAIQMEENVDLMEFALCDCCQQNRITHAVMQCQHYQSLCTVCVDKLQQEPQCKLCRQTHLIAKIFI